MSATELLNTWYNYGTIKTIKKKEGTFMPQIIPINKLKNTSEISELCHKTNEPIYVTKSGYGDMVIMSMEIYENIMRQVNRYQELEISEQQIVAGKTKDARRALAEMRERYDL
jgi:PHD/YefM family antitoxin component YafN of YafNO toxin-antitoxin module